MFSKLNFNNRDNIYILKISTSDTVDNIVKCFLESI